VIGDGGTVAAAVGAALLLNARYGPIGISVAPYLAGSVWSRFLRSQLVVDESWALAAEPDGRFSPKVIVGAGLMLYAGWVGGTAIGSIGRGARRPRGARPRRRLPRALPCVARSTAAWPSTAPGRDPRLGHRDRADADRTGRRSHHRRERRLRRRDPALSAPLLVVMLVGAGTIATKAAGPVLLGGRPLPQRLTGIVELLAPALLGALVAVQALGEGRSLVVDERLIGVAAAGIASWRKAPLLVVVVVAAAATALARAVT
jgi:branched-subunit amino acid transport protein